jgi:hypothetical protein
VYYPPDFEGRWKVSRLVASVAFPEGPEAVGNDEASRLKALEGTTESYEARYVRNQENIVVDRDFLERSRIQATQGKKVGVFWAMTNPNVLRCDHQRASSTLMHNTYNKTSC